MMESEASKFLRKHLCLGSSPEDELRDIRIPFNTVMNLMETFHAVESKKEDNKSAVMLPNDHEIEVYAMSQTLDKITVPGQGIGEIFMLKIGIEFGAKWMRKRAQRSKS